MDFQFDFDKEDRRKKRNHILSAILRWILELGAVILLAYVLVAFTVEQTEVIGNSMEETLMEGETILVNKLAFKRNPPERYDLIVFKQSGGEHMYYDIKRVIGLPGETIQIKEGEIYINGEMLIEPIKVEPILLPGFAESPVTLDEDEFFVLGDNRNNSEDSRFANVGNVVEDEIVGMAWLRINPFTFVNKSKKNYKRPSPTPIPTPGEETVLTETP